MIISVPKEIKNHEYRAGLTPNSVRELVAAKHEVLIEHKAGDGIGMIDDHYEAAGAKICSQADVFAKGELIVKVKEPQLDECKLLSSDQTLFAFLHLAADTAQTRLLQDSKVTAIAYETINNANNELPILAPMSEVAGKIAVQLGARCLEKIHGGKGVLLGGVPGVKASEVLVIGGGVVGTNAIRVALGMGARVTVLDTAADKLRQLEGIFGNQLHTVLSTQSKLAELLPLMDLVIGSVLVPGAAAPKIVSKAMVASMSPGSVVIDVAIDQGGCFATSKATDFANPTYLYKDIVHACVSNLPASVPLTSTLALNNVTLPYVLELAANKSAYKVNPYLANGVNVCLGEITNKAVALSLGAEYVPLGQR